MAINQQILDEWIELHKQRVEELFEDETRCPPEYHSNAEMYDVIRTETDNVLRRVSLESRGNPKLGVKEAAEIIVDKAAITCVPVKDGFSLAIYDYDKKIYTFNSMTVLNDLIVIILGASSQSIINSVMTTLVGLRFKAVPYNPLPQYKIAVGNGIYNCLTRSLEESTPRYTILTKISTNYVHNAPKPNYHDGFTLESMIGSLADEKPERVSLIGQICKAIITGHSLKPGLFVVLGRGGDGKSTFFTMIANMIGQENVAYVNFSDIDSPDKMAETANKKLVLGLDNDVKVYLRKTSLLKTMASHEMITLSRKYMSALSIPFTATMVQLCNDFPRIAETGSSMKRRVVPFRAERSHYELGSENDNVDTVYIKDQKFLEYALWYFLNEDTNPYYSDFNDVDRRVAFDAFDAEDIVGQFVNDLQALGVFTEINQYIPVSHLYAVYQDWMTINNPGSKMLSSRSFAMQIKDKLYDLGYSRSDESFRPHTLERQNLYSTETLGEYKTQTHTEKAIETNVSSRVFQKTHRPKHGQEVRRNSNQISVYQYFNIISAISSDMNVSYSAIYDQEDTPTEQIEENQQIEQHIEIDTSSENTSDEHSGSQKYDDIINIDLHNIYQHNLYDELSEYKALIDNYMHQLDDDEHTPIEVLSEFDTLWNQTSQIAYISRDSKLIAIQMTIKENRSPAFKDTLELLSDYLERLIEIVETNGGES